MLLTNGALALWIRFPSQAEGQLILHLVYNKARQIQRRRERNFAKPVTGMVTKIMVDSFVIFETARCLTRSTTSRSSFCIRPIYAEEIGI